MNARRPRRKRRVADCDHQITMGRTLAGTVVGRNGVFRARDAAGKSLGRFASTKEAMHAVTAAFYGHRDVMEQSR